MEHVVIHLSKPPERTPPRVNPHADCGLWVTMTCQCRFVNCTNTPSGGRVDSFGEAVFVEAGGKWELSVLSSQFCCQPETALKNKVY